MTVMRIKIYILSFYFYFYFFSVTLFVPYIPYILYITIHCTLLYATLSIIYTLNKMNKSINII